jgi:type I restriction enzyme R subunit
VGCAPADDPKIAVLIVIDEPQGYVHGGGAIAAPVAGAVIEQTLKYMNIDPVYSNEELVALTKELTEELRKNKTIDWQKKESARAKMRMLVKRLLKKYKYPPEGQEDALKTVISQCEMWTDNQNEKANKTTYDFENYPSQNLMVAEESPNYGK